MNYHNELHTHTQHPSRGAAMLILVVLFMVGSLVVVLATGRTAYYDLLRSRTALQSVQAFYASESGVEDALYRLQKGKTISTPIEVLTVAGATATTTITTSFDTATIDTTGTLAHFYRRNRVQLHLGAGASFNFGLQSSTGGITLANSSSVVGNVYSNGPVSGAGGNMIYGDAVSAGPSGIISGVHATASAYAHTIQSSTIDKNAYYQSISGSTVGGMSFPGSPDQPTTSLPIDDATIAAWEAEAEAGGVISSPCPGGVYTIDVDTTIGPKKITCDVEIDKASTDVTITGHLWITGNFSTKNGPNLRVDPGTIDKSMVIVADNPANDLTSSQMSLNQSTGFVGSGANSFLLLISKNKSASVGGSEVAIDAGNRTTDGEREVIYYAPYGKITANNSVKLRGATAYTIALANTASVDYRTGMLSLLFTGGPSGGYIIDSWREVE